jgi:hypothetical protein
MKVYNRKEFLKLPPGVFFTSGPQWAFSGFYKKGETVGDVDFYQTSFEFIEFKSSNDFTDMLEDSLKNKTSYPINQTEAREGLFDDDMMYLVYDKEDLNIIKKYIDKQ